MTKNDQYTDGTERKYELHEDHNVRERKGVWYCYDCGVGGDKDDE